MESKNSNTNSETKNDNAKNGGVKENTVQKRENFLRKTYNWAKRNSFWIGFLGLPLFMGSVVVFYDLLVEKNSPQLQKTLETNQFPINEIKKKIFETLRKNNEEIFARAYKASMPQIKKLEQENLEDVRIYVSKKLLFYFERIERLNTDKFLDWLYSFGTDYKVVFKQLKDGIKGIKCKTGNVEYCTNVSEFEEYIAQQVNRYLLNEKDLQRYLEEQIKPYLRKKLEEFAQKSLNIIGENYKREAQKLLKEEFKDIPSETLEWISQVAINQMEVKVTNLATQEMSQRLNSKMGFYSGILIAAKLTKKVVLKLSQKIAAKILQKVVAKVAGKTGAKALTGFGLGVISCAWAGPFSLLCGIAGGVTATVAGDYVLTKLDEAITRDDMKNEIINLLEEARRNLTLQVVEIHKTNLQGVEAILGEFSQKGSFTLKQITE